MESNKYEENSLNMTCSYACIIRESFMTPDLELDLHVEFLATISVLV